jgi:CrcB protein
VERESNVVEGLESEQRVAASGRSVDRRELALIFAGGFIGAIVRAGLAKSLHVAPGSWPWAIFAVNLAGAAVLSFVVTRDQQREVPSVYLLAFTTIGFCGALTTFSTLVVELLEMIDASRWGLALGYCGASIGGGLAAVVLASRLARAGGGES